MATNKSTVLIVLLILIRYLESSANGTPKSCMKCLKSKNGRYHHLPETFANVSKASRYTRDFFEHPEHSNKIHHQAKRVHQITQYDIGNKYSHDNSRVARAAQKPDSLANLRKKLKLEKQAESEKNLDLKQKLLKINATKIVSSGPHIGGISVKETPQRRQDNLRKLIELTNSERRGPQVHPGAECNFERECRWTWKTDIPNGFVIASSNNLLVNETGPAMDADNNVIASGVMQFDLDYQFQLQAGWC